MKKYIQTFSETNRLFAFLAIMLFLALFTVVAMSIAGSKNAYFILLSPAITFAADLTVGIGRESPLFRVRNAPVTHSPIVIKKLNKGPNMQHFGPDGSTIHVHFKRGKSGDTNYIDISITCAPGDNLDTKALQELENCYFDIAILPRTKNVNP